MYDPEVKGSWCLCLFYKPSTLTPLLFIIPSIFVPSSWDQVVTWHPLTYGMATTQYLLLKNTKNILNSYGRETHINLHAWLRGSSAPLSLHQTYETWVFVPQRIRTYLKWLPWWHLFIKMLPWGVPTQHWWYPNPASRFRFPALWSQISDNANPDLPSLGVYFKFSGQ